MKANISLHIKYCQNKPRGTSLIKYCTKNQKVNYMCLYKDRVTLIK